MLVKILEITGALCALVSVVGLINRFSGWNLGVSLRSGSTSGAIPGDSVIIGFLFVVSALCLLAAYFIDKHQLRRQPINLNQQN